MMSMTGMIVRRGPHKKVALYDYGKNRVNLDSESPLGSPTYVFRFRAMCKDCGIEIWCEYSADVVEDGLDAARRFLRGDNPFMKELRKHPCHIPENKVACGIVLG